MDKNFVLSGNKLIAEFMGFKYIPFNNNQELKPGWWVNPITRGQQDNEHVRYKLGKSRFLARSHHELKYHNSWNWLMPVVEKIEQMGYMVTIKTKMCSISRDNKGNSDSYLVKAKFGDQSKIEKLYDCIIAFIKYTNKSNL